MTWVVVRLEQTPDLGEGRRGEGGGVVLAGVAMTWNGAGHISACVLTHTMLEMSARAV